MKRLLLACPLFMALTACPPPKTYKAPPASQAQIFTAIGNEPGWNLTIFSDRIIYVGDYGETQITVDTPKPRFEGKKQIYESKPIAIRITPGPCSDTMVEREYENSVQINAQGKMLSGCGGGVLPPKSLAGTRWQVAAIDGRDLIETNSEHLIEFDQSAVSASIGCNRISGSFSEKSGVLRLGAIITTRKACPGQLGQDEALLVEILSTEPAVIYDDKGDMILKNDNHSLLLHRRF
ncbi:MAG: META domain-containing protein [Sphingomonadales bacterium]|nr:META domain-containing protein [Sphingomonadales bacterium]